MLSNPEMNLVGLRIEDVGHLNPFYYDEEGYARGINHDRDYPRPELFVTVLQEIVPDFLTEYDYGGIRYQEGQTIHIPEGELVYI